MRFENKKVVDVHRCIYTLDVLFWHIIGVYIRSVDFRLLIRSHGFPRTSIADKQEQKSAFFCMEVFPYIYDKGRGR